MLLAGFSVMRDRLLCHVVPFPQCENRGSTKAMPLSMGMYVVFSYFALLCTL